MDLLPDDQARIADQLAHLASGPEPDARRRILEAVSRAQIEPTPVPTAAASRIRRQLGGIVSALGNRRLQPIIAGMLVFALFVPLMAWRLSWSESIGNPQLSAQDSSLIGGVDEGLASQISFDKKNNQYVFDALGKTSPALPNGISQNQTGGGGNPYSVDLPLLPKQGLTYYDNTLQLSFSLVPNFGMGQAQQAQGRVLYGMPDSGKAVYTVKNNGLKEDIVYNTPVTKETLSYTLKLPDTLTARTIPNSGAIGIYSADRSLFQHISFGSDADKLKVMDARVKSDKTNLVFGIAPPSIKQTNQKPSNGTGNVRYDLNGNTMTVYANGLSNLSYPISVDPSVVVNTTAGFALGNNEGGIDFGTNQISRGTLTGGVLGSWTATSSVPGAGNDNFASVAYNGYVYELGGYLSGYVAVVNYAQINADGTIGAWAATTSLPLGNSTETSVAYNGYVYSIGGCGTSPCPTKVVDYALVCTGNNNGVGGCGATAGTLGTWTATTNLPAATEQATSVVYNGYLYEIGGWTTTYTTVVDYAPIQADGTLGAWAATTPLLNAEYTAMSVAYNGYLYEIGGYKTADTAAVDYAQINANGTIGAWTATTSLPVAIDSAQSVAYNGYLYVIGGENATNTITTVDYAPINANGTLGAWTATTSLPVAVMVAGSVVYNGYLYNIAGCTDTTCSGITAAVYHAPIQPAGYMGKWTATVSIATTHDDTASSVAYNGYLYVLGGCPSSCSSAPTTTIQYDTINADGTLGAAWTTAAQALPGARARATTVVYNGYLYELGGCSASCTGSATENNTVYYSKIGAAGAPGAWSTSTHTLPDQYQWASAFVYNGYIYHLGGCGGSTCPDTKVYYSQIASTGDIGAWTTNANALPLGTDAASVVAYDGFVWVLGVGTSSSGGGTVTVDYAQINTNGSIGSWASANHDLPTATQNGTAGASNGYVWFVGGYTNNPSTQVEYALICTGQNNGVQGCDSTPGHLGSWGGATVLPGAVYESAGAIYNGFFYNIGGNGTAVVDFAPLDAGGSGVLGSWTSATALPAVNNMAASVAYNGYLYEIGGSANANCGAGGAITTVDYVAIKGDGTLATPWNPTATLATAVCNASAIVYNGYVYVLGGCTGACAASTAAVQYAQINSNGTLASWATSSSSLPLATQSGTAAVYNGYVYFLGGCTSSCAVSTVDYAPINTDGTLGSWTAATNSLPATTWLASSVAYNGYLYEIGGCNVSGICAEVSTVDYAPLNADGSVGTWTATAGLPTAIKRGVAVASNGYLYEVGGSLSNLVQFAAINPSGTLNSWTGGTNLPTNLWCHSAAVYNGVVYVIGGDTSASLGACNTVTATVDYAPLNVMPMVGHYSYLTNLGTATNALTSVSFTGAMPAYTGPGNSYISYRTAPASAVLSASALASTLTGVNNAGPPTCAGTQQYVWVFLSLDDSTSFTFGGDSLRSNLTSFTMNYGTKHPAPNQRLRGGQYFLGTSPQPLDTCYP